MLKWADKRDIEIKRGERLSESRKQLQKLYRERSRERKKGREKETSE